MRLKNLIPFLALFVLLAGCLPPNLPTAPPPPTATATPPYPDNIFPTETQPAPPDEPNPLPTLLPPSPTDTEVVPPTLTNTPTNKPQPQSTRTPTRAATRTPTKTPTRTSTKKPTATRTPVVSNPNEFWVFFVNKHKLAALPGSSALPGGTTTPSLLTNTPAYDYRPTWSPDGKYLGFIRLYPNEMQSGLLYLLEGSKLRLLDSVNRYDNFAWLPEVAGVPNRIIATRGFPGGYEVVIIDPLTGSSSLLARGVVEFPVISPNRRYLAMLMNTGPVCAEMGCTTPNDVFLYDLAVRQNKRMTFDLVPKLNLAWSPDSKMIAYHTGTQPGDLVGIVLADGSAVNENQPPPWWTNPYVISPDKMWYAYYVNTSSAKLFVVPAGVGSPVEISQLTKTSTGDAPYINTLRWRPDSLGLVFNLSTDVYSIQRDGKNLRRLPLRLENVFFDVRPVTTAYTPPPAPGAPASFKICAGAPATRLDIGRQATVSNNPPTPNNVRSAPGKNQALLGQIKPGEKVTILEGPHCADNWVWWKINSLTTKLTGWTAEGDSKNYWLVPVK